MFPHMSTQKHNTQMDLVENKITINRVNNQHILKTGTRDFERCRRSQCLISADWSSEVLLVLLGLKIVVRTDFLHQPVIGAGEGDEDAYDLKGFGANPGCLRLRVFWVAGLAWVIHAGLGLLGPVSSLVFDPAVEFGPRHHHLWLLLLMVRRSRAGGLRRAVELGRHIWDQDWVFVVNGLSRWIQNLPSYRFGGRDDADGYVPQTGRVVAEVHTKSAVDVVNNFPCHQEAELHGLYVKVEIAPAQDLLGLWGSFGRRFGFRRGAV